MGNLFSRLFDGKKSLIFLGILFVFSLLIFKDPFSERTLIPNFEPYPDTFYYIYPALNFVKGGGFNLARDGRVVKISVPPLYSVSLIPAFILKQDPRMSYYTNVLLGFISLFFFWLILRIIFTGKLIVYVLLIFYVTNYYIYWLPSIIMAENLTLTLYLAGVFSLLSKTTIINSIFIAFLVVGIYATKYANVPVSGMIVLLYLIKTFSSKIEFKQKTKSVIAFLISLIFCYLLLASFETTSKGKNFLSQLLIVLDIIYNSIPKNSAISSAAPVSASSSWFGIEYVKQNLPFYLKTLFGAPNKFLWDSTPIVPNFIGILGCIGIIWNIFNKKFGFISMMFLTFIFSSIAFMSTFYTRDARYIYIAIPTLLIGFGLFLNCVESKIRINKKKILNIVIFILICIYLATNFIRIKSQISLNLRYAETPWNYIAVLKMNEYFTKEKIVDSKKPVLISALPPFLIDYYSNDNYTLLPLSYEQEFRGFKELVWGPNDYSDLPKLYRKYLSDSFDVYVSRAGLGNEGYTNRDFNIIVKEFDTRLVLPGCYDQCNIYSVKLKNK